MREKLFFVEGETLMNRIDDRTPRLRDQDQMAEADLTRLHGRHARRQTSGLLAHAKAIADGALPHVQRDAQPVDRPREAKLLVLAGGSQARKLQRRLELASVDPNAPPADLLQQVA